MTISSDKSIGVWSALETSVLSKVDAAHEMGIYDVKWLDQSTFVTCSADNTIKTWHVNSEGKVEQNQTFIQKDGPRDTNLQLLGLVLEPTQNHLTAVNLSGDLVQFNDFGKVEDKHPSKVITGHSGLISDIINFG